MLRLKHIHGSQVKTAHTNNIRVIHKDSTAFHDCPHVQRAYPTADKNVDEDDVDAISGASFDLCDAADFPLAVLLTLQSPQRFLMK